MSIRLGRRPWTKIKRGRSVLYARSSALEEREE